MNLLELVDAYGPAAGPLARSVRESACAGNRRIRSIESGGDPRKRDAAPAAAVRTPCGTGGPEKGQRRSKPCRRPDIKSAVIEVAPYGDRGRQRLVVLVTGRTAVTRIGGIASVARHVATAKRLGLDPLVIYPARMRALGAEIAGEVDEDTPCIDSDAFLESSADADHLVLVAAADWYVAPQAIVMFNDATSGPAVARFEERGRTVAPVARMRIAELRSLVPRLEEGPTAELILSAVGPSADAVSLLVSERHRLSDNVAVAHCEDKLFSSLGEGDEPWHVAWLHDLVAIPITRVLARTRTTPAQLAAVKIALGLGGAWIMAGPSYWGGVIGATLALFSRVLDAIAADLARAAVRDSAQNDPYDLAGDVAVQLAVVWAIAARLSSTGTAVLAGIASAGILASAVVSYQRVFRHVWAAQKRGERHDVPRHNYGSRFARRNGPAYGLFLAAVFGRLDLFLWAATIVSHAFYIGWLRSEEPARR